jgi:Flp pilus assembly pilin Flp
MHTPTIAPDMSNHAGAPLADESGQATAEYALVLVAAAIVALALITWASTTDMLPSFFNTVMEKVISVADGIG